MLQKVCGSKGFKKPSRYQKEKDFPPCFIFFSLPDPSRIWHSEGVGDNIRFLCIKPIRPVVNSGFVNQDFDWNVTPEGGMYGFWSSPESPEELGLTCEASISPRKSLVLWLVVWFMAVFPGKERRLLS
ncbi:hypothetical protein HJG60_009091 [Phyllostomus discolor]|uniref:Uncharacterized protein n=1 Tax=Phyllostomus discolor TaxID=89673 RepID=A0A833YPV6_9CHIR|nr:hypothetical protein HJG60_009091 [Phyllostomus discolor]